MVCFKDLIEYYRRVPIEKRNIRSYLETLSPEEREKYRINRSHKIAELNLEIRRAQSKRADEEIRKYLDSCSKDLSKLTSSLENLSLGIANLKFTLEAERRKRKARGRNKPPI